jgi:hypothetical protein
MIAGMKVCTRNRAHSMLVRRESSVDYYDGES